MSFWKDHSEELGRGRPLGVWLRIALAALIIGGFFLLRWLTGGGVANLIIGSACLVFAVYGYRECRASIQELHDKDLNSRN